MMRKLLFSALFLLLGTVGYAADTYTTRMGLTKPEDGSTGWGTKIRGDFDIIDSSVAILTSTNTQTFSGPLVFSGALTISTMTPTQVLIDTPAYTGQSRLVANGLSTFLARSDIITTNANTYSLFVTTNSAIYHFAVSTNGVAYSKGLVIDTLASGECVQTATGGRLSTTGAACGAGGGGSGIAVFEGTVKISSPTQIFNFDSTDFNASLVGGGTATITLGDAVTISTANIEWINASSGTLLTLYISTATAGWANISTITARSVTVSSSIVIGSWPGTGFLDISTGTGGSATLIRASRNGGPAFSVNAVANVTASTYNIVDANASIGLQGSEIRILNTNPSGGSIRLQPATGNTVISNSSMTVIGSVTATKVTVSSMVVWADGTISTTSVAGGGGAGSITGVFGGTGLTGGGTSGGVTLALASTVAYTNTNQTFSQPQTITSSFSVVASSFVLRTVGTSGNAPIIWYSGASYAGQEVMEQNGVTYGGNTVLPPWSIRYRRSDGVDAGYHGIWPDSAENSDGILGGQPYRYWDTTNNQYVQFQSSPTITHTQKYRLPSSTGSVDNVLGIRNIDSNGFVNLEWQTDDTGGVGGGGSTLSVWEGATKVSSPTANIAFSPGAFNVTLVGDSTAYIEISSMVVTVSGNQTIAAPKTHTSSMTFVDQIVEVSTINMKGGSITQDGTVFARGTNWNTVLGRGVGWNASAQRNTVMGSGAHSGMGASTYDNTYVGYNSGNSGSAGSNSCLGSGACASVGTTANNNTGIGRGTLATMAGATANTAVGDSAMGANTVIGVNNTVMGVDSANRLTTGLNNTCVGHTSCYSGSGASDNTSIGYQAGSVLTLGSSNTFVGSGATAGSNSINKSIAIGYGAVATSSNVAKIGGEGSNSVMVLMSSMTVSSATIYAVRLSSMVVWADGTISTTAVVGGSTVSGGKDDLGSHVSTKTLTAGYGLTTSTIGATAFNSSVTSMTITGGGGLLTGDATVNGYLYMSNGIITTDDTSLEFYYDPAGAPTAYQFLNLSNVYLSEITDFDASAYDQAIRLKADSNISSVHENITLDSNPTFEGSTSYGWSMQGQTNSNNAFGLDIKGGRDTRKHYLQFRSTTGVSRDGVISYIPNDRLFVVNQPIHFQSSGTFALGVVSSTAVFTSSMTLSGSQLVRNVPASDGQVLKWNNGSSYWEPSTDNTGSGGASSLAITAGPVRSSPTSDAMFNPNQFSGVVSGSSITLSLDSLGYKLSLATSAMQNLWKIHVDTGTMGDTITRSLTVQSSFTATQGIRTSTLAVTGDNITINGLKYTYPSAYPGSLSCIKTDDSGNIEYTSCMSGLIGYQVALSTGVTGVLPYQVSLATGAMQNIWKISLATGTMEDLPSGLAVSLATGTILSELQNRKVSLSTGVINTLPYQVALGTGVTGVLPYKISLATGAMENLWKIGLSTGTVGTLGYQVALSTGVTGVLPYRISLSTGAMQDLWNISLTTGTVGTLPYQVSLATATMGTIPAAQLPNPAAAALGGIKSLTCGGTDKVSAIGTDGLPVCSADSTGAPGGGDMVLADTQTITGSKVFVSSRAIVARPVGVLGASDNNDGGVLFDMSKSSGHFVVIYDSSAQTTADDTTMLYLKSENHDYLGYFLRIKRTDTNSNGDIRIDAPNPNIEFVETDTDSAKGFGKYEMSVQGDVLKLAHRNLADNTFEDFATMQGWDSTEGPNLTLTSKDTAKQTSLRFAASNGSYVGLVAPDAITGSWTHDMWATSSNTGKLLIQTSDSAPRPLGWSSTVGVSGSSITFAGGVQVASNSYLSAGTTVYHRGIIETSATIVTGQLVIPQSANAKADQVGAVAFDTTDNTLVINDGTSAKVYAHPVDQFTVTIGTETGGWNNNTIPIWQAPKDMAITITQIEAATYSVATSTLTFGLEERPKGALNSAGTDVFTLPNSSATWTGSTYASFANAEIAAGAYLVFDTDSTAEAGTVQYVTITVYYTKNRE